MRKIWDRIYLPHSRSEMCRQLGLALFGSEKVVKAMPGTYGEQWGEFLDMVVDQREVSDGQDQEEKMG